MFLRWCSGAVWCPSEWSIESNASLKMFSPLGSHRVLNSLAIRVCQHLWLYPVAEYRDHIWSLCTCSTHWISQFEIQNIYRTHIGFQYGVLCTCQELALPWLSVVARTEEILFNAYVRFYSRLCLGLSKTSPFVLYVSPFKHFHCHFCCFVFGTPCPLPESR